MKLLKIPLLLTSAATFLHATEKPNVIIIMTDDQSYSEIAAHGNPIIKTPHMDALHAESVRFTDFHVENTLLIDLLKLKKLAGPPLDGISLASVLREPEATLPERTLFVDVQRAYLPPKWINSAVMTSRWRLVDGKELYDIKADPGQESDIAVQHPETVAHLRAEQGAYYLVVELLDEE